MKKLTFLLLLSLIFVGKITAQESDNKKSRQLSHEIGINATRLIQQIIPFGDTTVTSSPYFITYKLMTKYALGFRAGLGGRYNRKKEKVENFEDSATTVNNSLDLRIGIEWQQAIGRRWKTSVGIDFINSLSLNKNTVDSGFDFVTFEEKSLAFGGGPVLGLAFNINDKISLYTEGAAYFTTGKSSNAVNFRDHPEFNDETANRKDTSFRLHVPTTLYLVFTF